VKEGYKEEKKGKWEGRKGETEFGPFDESLETPLLLHVMHY